jgi:hypothetical protein
MKLFTSGFAALVTLSTVGLVVAAAEKHVDHSSAKSGAKSDGFERIKSLSGEWKVSEGSGEHGEDRGTVTYKATAGNSAVLETLFRGTEHEMVTLYFVDKDGLALTHYCMLGNRPHMRAQPGSKDDKLAFKCSEGDNSAIESEVHMHQVTFTFTDPDHVKTEWVLYKGGKPDSTHSFKLVRMHK